MNIKLVIADIFNLKLYALLISKDIKGMLPRDVKFWVFRATKNTSGVRLIMFLYKKWVKNNETVAGAFFRQLLLELYWLTSKHWL